MGKSQWYIGAVNGVVLCVDSMQGTGFKSRVYHAYRRDAVKVSCIEQLLFVGRKEKTCLLLMEIM